MPLSKRELQDLYDKQVPYKCTQCRCCFVTKSDLDAHMKACHQKRGDWFEGRHGYQLKRAEKDQYLTNAVKQSGKVMIGCYEYSLSNDGNWLKRRLV